MKKYLILFLMAGTLILSSCSKDENENGPQDPIIGTWALVSVNPPNVFFSANACTEQSFITLAESNRANGTFYLANNNCAPQSSAGTWSNMGDSNYKLSVPIMGSQEIAVDFNGSGSFSVDFQDTKLTFERID